ncbi:MAG: HAD-IIB family hydrolase [Thermodesulfobacteriota bacterium]
MTPIPVPIQYMVFSDLDGTLLDRETYDFHLALEALDLINRKQIPLILCSSKTRAEMELLRVKLGNRHPFIVENGGAIFIPRGLFILEGFNVIIRDEYQVIELGQPYKKILQDFKNIKKETSIPALGFSDLSVEEISRLTGLSPEQALPAKEREYSEPFLYPKGLSPKEISLWEQTARKMDLQITLGGRFFQLTGSNDKGRAVQILKHLYGEKFADPLISIGLGDSPNDFSLLQHVDIPVLLSKQADGFEPWPFPTPLQRPSEIGPKGWNTFILNFFAKEDGP